MSLVVQKLCWADGSWWKLSSFQFCSVDQIYWTSRIYNIWNNNGLQLHPTYSNSYLANLKMFFVLNVCLQNGQIDVILLMLKNCFLSVLVGFNIYLSMVLVTILLCWSRSSLIHQYWLKMIPVVVSLFLLHDGLRWLYQSMILSIEDVDFNRWCLVDWRC